MAYPGREVVVVCHGGVIGTLLRYTTGGDRPAAGELIPNGSIHEFRWQGGRLHLESVVSAR